MWWSRPARRLALCAVLMAAGPSGCGFRPLYGSTSTSPGVASAAAEQLSGIYVDAIADRLGQQLRNALHQRLTPAGEPAAPQYRLAVLTSQSLEGLGHRKDAKATLGRMTLTASFTLVDSGGHHRMSGASRSLVSFNYLGPRYASIAAERDAEERAISDVAEDIRRQLAVYFETKGPAPERP
jgi:LPS-assembly lipoprotein